MTTLRPILHQIPPDVASVADYEHLARPRVPEQVWAYLSGGAADEWTVRENHDAFQRLTLRTRVLRSVADGHTRLTLFGQPFRSPIFLAPVAYQKLFHPEGELTTALAASALQTGAVISTLASTAIEDVARQATAPLWFQLYIQPDREFTRVLVKRAEAAGYQALVVTVDAAVNGVRNREQRAGFQVPAHIEAVNLRCMRPLEPAGSTADDAVLFGSALLASAPTWDDIAWLRSVTTLPIVLKGIATAEDAGRATAAGVDGIVVSNHGGRVLDTMPATIDMLEEISAAVEKRIPILLDGGIRRGSDVFKALALGADAVLIGRPYIHGLAAAGAIGICHVLRILQAELEVTMALTGCATLDDIRADAVSRVGRRGSEDRR